MKKAAGILACVLAFQAPLAVFGGLMTEEPVTLTFEQTACVLPVVLPTEAPQEEEVVFSATMEEYFTRTAPLATVEEAEEGTVDKGFAASAQIDTTKPILQEPSGTVIAGYFAPSKYKLNDTERDLVERVVMSEVSGKSYEDALAVAQAIYDRSVDWKQTVTETIYAPYQFAGPTKRYTPTATVKKAVSDVFDKGYKLTKEHLYYYYATRSATPTSFHETQRCLVETKLHRYFGPWK